MEKFSITRFVPEVLQGTPGERLTAREVATRILQKHPDACEAKRQRSRAVVQPLDSNEGLLQQIVAEIGAQRPVLEKRYNIKTTEGRPRKYFYSTTTDNDDVAAVEEKSPHLALIAEVKNDRTTSTRRRLLEVDLYPLLSQFLFSELNVHSKRIDEKRSKNTRGPDGNKWLYPDLVGVEDLTENWEREIVECASAYSDTRTKLYSFEVKLLLNRSNVRESYFQAVSNSSWANLPYLVAAEIQAGETISELRVLSSSHGVGIIRLDVEDPTESEIVIPARERPSVDWNSANRLAAANRDFINFVKLVRRFYQTGDLRSRDWDYSGAE